DGERERRRPRIERNPREPHGQCRVNGVLGAWYTILPRKSVNSHLRSFKAAVETVYMSPSQTATSASFPTSIEPIRSSRNNWCAAQIVWERSAVLMSIDSCVPNGVLPYVPLSVSRATDAHRL